MTMRMPVLMLVLVAISSLMTVPMAKAEHDAKAVSRAEKLLSPASMGKTINNYLHFGTTYRSHGDMVLYNVDNRPTEFALLVTFKWESNGVGTTKVFFFFNSNGAFIGLRVKESDGLFQSPFTAANLTIKLLGEALYEAFKDNMTDGDKQFFRTAIDNADAKSLLELYLVLESRLK
ncbi:hypothetical protein [Tuwongella immobilis]|uniref:Uncharacterized protein n=1 Tax=Tuwongella immobilis TaxID=692036 RepID=A0A6C2YLG8_9BACT|nr:hypothetical protein [Tuwongella immobilis]VIP02224.1 unnamed protein product [Tuwongella immobilis]VTS00759.1 unnamed protein product [Tuwongella immobilis]